MQTAKLFILVIIFSMQAVTTSLSSSLSMERRAERDKQSYTAYIMEQTVIKQLSIEKRMYDSVVIRSAKWLKTGFVPRQIKIESGGNQNAISPEGATGIAQFLPSTWGAMKRNKLIPQWFLIGNEMHQRIAQLIYLNHLYDQWYDQPAPDRKALTAASYNAGIGTIKDLVKLYGNEWRNYLPEETIKYLENLKNYI